MRLRESLPFIACKQPFAFPNAINVLALTFAKFGISDGNRIGSFRNDSRVKMTLRIVDAFALLQLNSLVVIFGLDVMFVTCVALSDSFTSNKSGCCLLLRKRIGKLSLFRFYSRVESKEHGLK